MKKTISKILIFKLLCASIFCFSSEVKKDMEIDVSKNNTIKAVVFDYGGVLAKISMSSTLHFMAEEFGVSEDDIKSVFKHNYVKHRMNLFSDEDFWGVVSEGLSKPIPEGINERYKKEIYDMLMMLDSKRELIRSLRDKGYKVYMLSNQYPHFNDVLKQQKAFDEFDCSVVSCDYGIKKPTLELYKILLNQIKETPEECLFVDDTYENIEAAKILGFNTFYYNVFKHSQKEFEQYFDSLPIRE